MIVHATDYSNLHMQLRELLFALGIVWFARWIHAGDHAPKVPRVG